MTSELQFPKASGDVFYASESNKIHFGEFGTNLFGDGSDGALTVSSGTTTISTQTKNYTSISISNGATLTFDTFGKSIIHVRGNMTINGALAAGNKVGTAPTGYDGGNGGDGGSNVAGTAGAAQTNPDFFRLHPNKEYYFEGGDGGDGPIATGNYTAGGGGGGGAYGAGGAGGVYSSATLSHNGPGGGGAGKETLIFYIAGDLTLGSTGSISGVGDNGGNGVDYGGNRHGGGGGGGGGGACIIFIVGGNITLTAGGTASVDGGNGGNGGAGGGGYYPGGGGGGGGAGVLVMRCARTLTNGITATATGGTAGTGGSGQTNGGNGIVDISSMAYNM